MKKHSFFRAALVLVMVFTMMMSTALTVFAASGNNKITIHPNGQQGLGGEDRFQAYCIFEGTLGTNPEELEGLTWGHGVDSKKLVDAMKADTTVMKNGEKFGEVFTREYNEWKSQHYNEYDEAVFVARFLGKTEHFNDPAYADDFARLVAENLKPANIEQADAPGASDDGQKFNPYKSTVVGSDWVINVPHPGYYLVKDTYVSEEGNDKADGSVSSYILEVIGNASVDLKATVPVVEKKVEGQDGYMTGTFNDLTFTLTGTVAENIGEYETYTYEFTDTLTSGLSAKTDGLTVTVTATGLSRPATFSLAEDYTVALTPDGTDDVPHTLTVTFADLIKSLKSKAPTLDLSDPEVAKSIKIIVTYTASLNEHAAMGADGNSNVVKLKYSNDPYSGGTGETINDEVKTYTIALQILKHDEKGQPISGVTFKLKNGEDKYATFKKTTEKNGEEVYTITGWVDASGGNELVTDESGVFNIHGLDVGKYTLEEISTKEDYELMKPIVFNITSSENGKGHVSKSGEMGTITLTRDESNKDRDDVTLNNTDFAGHHAQMTLVNNPSPILPHTGGIGAGIVLGVSALVVMLGASVITLALRKKKSE